MLKTRPALVALLAAAAALLVLLAASSAAPAQDLESKLEAKEAKLSKVRERRGVLTTTISHYGDRIDRLTAEVAALRDREAAVRVRSTPSRPNSTALSPSSTSPRSTWRR